jgi:uncharacterized protein
MKSFSALISGLLFGLGLIVANMVAPQKVLNFLDITGNWDASLALVMAAGLAVFSSGYFLLVKPRKTPILANNFFIPQRKAIDNKLILGAICFGLGWGLTGICPGPAITNILGGNVKIFVFITFMLIGMYCARLAIITSESKLPLSPANNKV